MTELTFSFPCNDEQLIGIIHLPEQCRKTGILMLSAGELQYRAGCARQLVTFARKFARRGTAVMRFDQRGIGDSVGDMGVYQDLGPDINTAIAQFRAQVPGLETVVLWGGCDAAAAIMINAHSDPQVSGWILSNPFLATDKVKAIVSRQQLLQRLLQPDFYRKLLVKRSLIAAYLRTAIARPFKKRSPMTGAGESSVAAPKAVKIPADLPIKMQQGLADFKGSTLLVMSERSLVRQQFDAFTARHKRWKTALRSPDVTRVDVESADQTFSTPAAQQAFIAASIEWLEAGGN
ncbi:hydrolase 1, exosortase A system-associated [Halieaceae bacterium IMCC14734]|uniref:Hydrolase 1, exosortase A system-associated n=1 Tax=Candidatus Litorirhabdus singularis TaxID=2518993 RepID=A0ABT3TH39_9GAMM|nr:hydrolase 1, exosortase A system-associated [Candidatus Litorirhabdus singularis]MCX2981319.1 hydrolase 1, exosortase A system-associated [Candidatus Litorirhabdus singularis]